MKSQTPFTVYLRLPEADLKPLAPMVRLISQTIIHDGCATYDKRKGEGCYPLLLLLDEAGRVKIPDLDEYATTVVGRDMILWVAIQSIKQLDIYGEANAETLMDNMDTQIFYRQRGTTARYLERETGYHSAYSRSTTSREGAAQSQGMAEQRVPLWTANQFKQMRDEDIIVFHHNLPPFPSRRMSWLEHPVLRQRQATAPPQVRPLPQLTPVKLRSPVIPGDDD